MQAVERVGVVSLRRGRRAAAAGLAAAAAAALLAIGYALGTQAGDGRGVWPVAAEGGVAPPTPSVSAVMPQHSVSATVEAGANERLRRTVRTLRDRIGALEEELGFYQRLVAPSAARRGVDIAHWAVAKTETAAEYAYTLVLTHIVDRHELIEGTVRVAVVGDQDGGAKTVPLADLAIGDAVPATFEFLYFQDFNGRMALPPGFRPSQVEVTAELADSGEAPVQRVFDWRVGED